MPPKRIYYFSTIDEYEEKWMLCGCHWESPIFFPVSIASWERTKLLGKLERNEVKEVWERYTINSTLHFIFSQVFCEYKLLSHPDWCLIALSNGDERENLLRKEPIPPALLLFSFRGNRWRASARVTNRVGWHSITTFVFRWCLYICAVFPYPATSSPKKWITHQIKTAFQK